VVSAPTHIECPVRGGEREGRGAPGRWLRGRPWWRREGTRGIEDNGRIEVKLTGGTRWSAVESGREERWAGGRGERKKLGRAWWSGPVAYNGWDK
jgi:hypothetical protein